MLEVCSLVIAEVLKDQTLPAQTVTAVQSDCREHLKRTKADLKRLKLYRRPRPGGNVVTLGIGQQKPQKQQQQQSQPQSSDASSMYSEAKSQQPPHYQHHGALRGVAHSSMSVGGSIGGGGGGGGAGRGWEAAPERDTGSVVVLRKSNGLAVQNPFPQAGGGRPGLAGALHRKQAAMSVLQHQPGGGGVGGPGMGMGGMGGGGTSHSGAKMISRHCQHVPSDTDLSALSLGVVPSSNHRMRGGGRGGGHGSMLPPRHNGGRLGGGGGQKGPGNSGHVRALLAGNRMDGVVLGGTNVETAFAPGAGVRDGGVSGGGGGGGGGGDGGAGGIGGGGRQQQQQQQQRVFSAAEELEAVVDKYGEEAERFCQWYRREEGVAPSAELVLKICEQMKERGGAP
jgi:hypothetical protein